MCGIAGILNIANKPGPYSKALLSMSAAMQKRGPDDEGFVISGLQEGPVEIFAGDNTGEIFEHLPFSTKRHISSSRYNNEYAYLVHRRLSIIDLSPTGHQPMCDQSCRYWILFNGVIYNYKELAGELEKKGIKFLGSSDTEVLLYAYREWGVDALQKINGMFSFVIWDNKTKDLFCARDRVGIKPFYYIHTEEIFLFASDIKTIIASGLYSAKVDLEGLYHAMSFGVAPRPLTAFKGVKALEQGHWMRVDSSGRAEKKSYWQLPVGTQDPAMTEHEAVALFEEQLTISVNKMLIADVTVGTFMSGGIDSTTISAISALHQPGIKVLTLAFEKGGSKFDELEQARSVAEMYAMDHLICIAKPEKIINYLEQMILCFEEPFYTLAPSFLLSEFAAENGVKVVLNGLGADELLGGYRRYQWINRWQKFRQIPFQTIVINLLKMRWPYLAESLKAETPDRLHTVLLACQNDNEKQKLFNSSDVSKYDSIEGVRQLYNREGKKFSDAFEAMSFMDMTNYLSNHHVYRQDQYTMHFSIEGRFPFLDHELIELAYKIPSCLKLSGNHNKFVLRKVAEKIIHPSCLTMPKKGFSLPLKEWMNGVLSGFVKEKISALCQRDIFNADEILSRYAKFKVGRYSAKQIWHLVSVELWYELFLD